MFYQRLLRHITAVASMLLIASALLPGQAPTRAASAAPSPAATGRFTTYLPLMTSTSGGGVSSEALIDQALVAGTIDRDSAALYKVYAVFADTRLPAQYRGDDRATMPSSTLRRVVGAYPTLKPATQAQIAPFLLPPSAPGSWLEQREAGQLAGMTSQALPKVAWRAIQEHGSPFKVWYQPRYGQRDADYAASMYEILEVEIWPKLIPLMGEPMSDITQPNDGGDSAFDIYILDNVSQTVPYGRCDNTPAYVLLDRTAYNQSELAVRVMDAILYGYDVGGPCSEYNWLHDATALWAADHVLPGVQYEHKVAPYQEQESSSPLPILRQGAEPALARFFSLSGRYIWPFYLARVLGQPNLIRTIWDNTRALDSAAAINSAIPGGFEQQWPRFAQESWNRDPAAKYKTLDSIQGGAKPVIDEVVKLQGAGYRSFEMPADVLGLAIEYYHYTFDDPAISTVLFENAFHNSAWPTAHVTGWVRMEGKQNWEQAEDWTQLPEKLYCRDLRLERVAEMVVIVSNSEWQDRDHQLKPAKPPRLSVSNIGCRAWTGSAHLAYDLPDPAGDVHERYVTDFSFELAEFPGEWPEEQGPGLFFRPKPTSTQVRISGWYWYEFEPRQCSYDVSGAFPIDVEGSYLSIGIGPERGYGGQGYLDRQGAMDVPDTCGGTAHYDYDDINHMWWKAYDTVEEAEQLVIDPSGRRISGSYTSGGGTYTWELTAADPE